MEPAEVFAKFKEQDFKIVRLDDLGKVETLRPLDVAQAIIDASEHGARLVNFRLSTSDEYWNGWTHHGHGKGAVLDAALETLGYLATFQTNPTSDGRYYSLQRKE